MAHKPQEDVVYAAKMLGISIDAAEKLASQLPARKKAMEGTHKPGQSSRVEQGQTKRHPTTWRSASGSRRDSGERGGRNKEKSHRSRDAGSSTYDPSHPTEDESDTEKAGEGKRSYSYEHKRHSKSKSPSSDCDRRRSSKKSSSRSPSRSRSRTSKLSERPKDPSSALKDGKMISDLDKVDDKEAQRQLELTLQRIRQLEDQQLEQDRTLQLMEKALIKKRKLDEQEVHKSKFPREEAARSSKFPTESQDRTLPLMEKPLIKKRKLDEQEVHKSKFPREEAARSSKFPTEPQTVPYFNSTQTSTLTSGSCTSPVIPQQSQSQQNICYDTNTGQPMGQMSGYIGQQYTGPLNNSNNTTDQQYYGQQASYRTGSGQTVGYNTDQGQGSDYKSNIGQATSYGTDLSQATGSETQQYGQVAFEPNNSQSAYVVPPWQTSSVPCGASHPNGQYRTDAVHSQEMTVGTDLGQQIPPTPQSTYPVQVMRNQNQVMTCQPISKTLQGMNSSQLLPAASRQSVLRQVQTATQFNPRPSNHSASPDPTRKPPVSSSLPPISTQPATESSPSQSSKKERKTVLSSEKEKSSTTDSSKKCSEKRLLDDDKTTSEPKKKKNRLKYPRYIPSMPKVATDMLCPYCHGFFHPCYECPKYDIECCSKCGERGHKSRECTKDKSSSDVNKNAKPTMKGPCEGRDKSCLKCGGSGHCPKVCKKVCKKSKSEVEDLFLYGNDDSENVVLISTFCANNNIPESECSRSKRRGRRQNNADQGPDTESRTALVKPQTSTLKSGQGATPEKPALQAGIKLPKSTIKPLQTSGQQAQSISKPSKMSMKQKPSLRITKPVQSSQKSQGTTPLHVWIVGDKVMNQAVLHSCTKLQGNSLGLEKSKVSLSWNTHDNATLAKLQAALTIMRRSAPREPPDFLILHLGKKDFYESNLNAVCSLVTRACYTILQHLPHCIPVWSDILLKPIQFSRTENKAITAVNDWARSKFIKAGGRVIHHVQFVENASHLHTSECPTKLNKKGLDMLLNNLRQAVQDIVNQCHGTSADHNGKDLSKDGGSLMLNNKKVANITEKRNSGQSSTQVASSTGKPLHTQDKLTRSATQKASSTSKPLQTPSKPSPSSTLEASCTSKHLQKQSKPSLSSTTISTPKSSPGSSTVDKPLHTGSTSRCFSCDSEDHMIIDCPVLSAPTLSSTEAKMANSRKYKLLVHHLEAYTEYPRPTKEMTKKDFEDFECTTTMTDVGENFEDSIQHQMTMLKKVNIETFMFERIMESFVCYPCNESLHCQTNYDFHVNSQSHRKYWNSIRNAANKHLHCKLIKQLLELPTIHLGSKNDGSVFKDGPTTQFKMSRRRKRMMEDIHKNGTKLYFVCRICGIPCRGPVQAHIDSAKHQFNATKLFQCKECHLFFEQQHNLDDHLSSMLHKLVLIRHHKKDYENRDEKMPTKLSMSTPKTSGAESLKTTADKVVTSPTSTAGVAATATVKDKRDITSKSMTGTGFQTMKPTVMTNESTGAKSKDVQTLQDRKVSHVSLERQDENMGSQSEVQLQPVGMEFVMPVVGFFCKLCDRFFDNSKTNTDKHCCTTGHRTNAAIWYLEHKKPMPPSLQSLKEVEAILARQDQKKNAAQKRNAVRTSGGSESTYLVKEELVKCDVTETLTNNLNTGKNTGDIKTGTDNINRTEEELLVNEERVSQAVDEGSEGDESMEIDVVGYDEEMDQCEEGAPVKVTGSIEAGPNVTNKNKNGKDMKSSATSAEKITNSGYDPGRKTSDTDQQSPKKLEDLDKQCVNPDTFVQSEASKGAKKKCADDVHTNNTIAAHIGDKEDKQKNECMERTIQSNNNNTFITLKGEQVSAKNMICHSGKRNKRSELQKKSGKKRNSVKVKRPVVVIAGDTCVRKYSYFLKKNPLEPVWKRLAEVLFHDVESRTIKQFTQHDLPVIEKLKPDIVLLHLGTSDVVAGCKPDQVSLCLLKLAEKLHKELHIELIYVCELLNRHSSHTSNPKFNDKLQIVNNNLKQELSTINYAEFWYLEQEHLALDSYDKDLVCLNEKGCQSLHEQLNLAMVHALDIWFSKKGHTDFLESRQLFKKTKLCTNNKLKKCKDWCKDVEGSNELFCSDREECTSSKQIWTILIVGHSFVSCLQTSSVLRDFIVNNCKVVLDGVDGITVNNFSENYSSVIEKNKPDMLVLQLGTNDLANPKSTPEMVATALVDLAEEIFRDFNTKLVYICEIVQQSVVPANVHNFNQKVDLCNQFLETKLENNNRCSFWKHASDTAPLPSQLDTCGVHLNQEGTNKLYSTCRLLVCIGQKKLNITTRNSKHKSEKGKHLKNVDNKSETTQNVKHAGISSEETTSGRVSTDNSESKAWPSSDLLEAKLINTFVVLNEVDSITCAFIGHQDEVSGTRNEQQTKGVVEETEYARRQNDHFSVNQDKELAMKNGDTGIVCSFDDSDYTETEEPNPGLKAKGNNSLGHAEETEKLSVDIESIDADIEFNAETIGDEFTQEELVFKPKVIGDVKEKNRNIPTKEMATVEGNSRKMMSDTEIDLNVEQLTENNKSLEKNTHAMQKLGRTNRQANIRDSCKDGKCSKNHEEPVNQDNMSQHDEQITTSAITNSQESSKNTDICHSTENDTMNNMPLTESTSHSKTDQSKKNADLNHFKVVQNVEQITEDANLTLNKDKTNRPLIQQANHTVDISVCVSHSKDNECIITGKVQRDKNTSSAEKHQLKDKECSQRLSKPGQNIADVSTDNNEDASCDQPLIQNGNTVKSTVSVNLTKDNEYLSSQKVAVSGDKNSTYADKHQLKNKECRQSLSKPGPIVADVSQDRNKEASSDQPLIQKGNIVESTVCVTQTEGNDCLGSHKVAVLEDISNTSADEHQLKNKECRQSLCKPGQTISDASKDRHEDTSSDQPLIQQGHTVESTVCITLTEDNDCISNINIAKQQNSTDDIDNECRQVAPADGNKTELSESTTSTKEVNEMQSCCITPSKHKIVIAGHSTVTQMESFIDAMREVGITEGFDFDNSKVELHSAEGETMEQFLESLANITKVKPDIVILQLGTVQLIKSAVTPEKVASNLINLIQKLHYEIGIRHIVLCQALPCLTPPPAGQTVNVLNEVLERNLECIPYATFWEHNDMWNSELNVYHPDGVQWNDVGLFILFKSFKEACVNGVQFLIDENAS